LFYTTRLGFGNVGEWLVAAKSGRAGALRNAKRFSVAQVGNLLYPPTGSRRNVGFWNSGGLPIRDTADCQSALRRLQLRRTKFIAVIF
jgi:hypothetical protein